MMKRVNGMLIDEKETGDDLRDFERSKSVLRVYENLFFSNTDDGKRAVEAFWAVAVDVDKVLCNISIFRVKLGSSKECRSMCSCATMDAYYLRAVCRVGRQVHWS